MKSLVGFGLLWAGYLLAWYGWTNLQHKGVGIVDLAFPSRLPLLGAAMGAPSGAHYSPSPPPNVPQTVIPALGPWTNVGGATGPILGTTP